MECGHVAIPAWLVIGRAMTRLAEDCQQARRIRPRLVETAA